MLTIANRVGLQSTSRTCRGFLLLDHLIESDAETKRWCVAVLGYGHGVFAPGRTSNRAKSDVGDSSTEPWMSVFLLIHAGIWNYVADNSMPPRWIVA